MFEGRGKLRTLLGIVAQPVQQLGKAPLRRIHTAAPLNDLESLAMRDLGDFGGFPFCAMVAPQVIVAQRLHVLAHWNDRRACSVESNRLYLLSRNAALFDRVVSC